MRKKLLRAYWLGNVLTLVIVIAFAAVMIAADIDADEPIGQSGRGLMNW